MHNRQTAPAGAEIYIAPGACPGLSVSVQASLCGSFFSLTDRMSDGSDLSDLSDWSDGSDWSEGGGALLLSYGCCVLYIFIIVCGGGGFLLISRIVCGRKCARFP